jgi:hypothetical protein
MTASALRLACLALPLVATACFSPLLEVGSMATVAIPPKKPVDVGGGFRNMVALGIVPKEGYGAAVRIEALSGFDTRRGTQAALRVFGGVAYTASPPRHLSAEVGADIGSRLDGGITEHDWEVGLRGGLVWSLGPPRTLFEHNKAFVILGSGVDVVPTLRVGYVWNRPGPTLVEINPGLSLRIRIWTDVF